MDTLVRFARQMKKNAHDAGNIVSYKFRTRSVYIEVGTGAGNTPIDGLNLRGDFGCDATLIHPLGFSVGC